MVTLASTFLEQYPIKKIQKNVIAKHIEHQVDIEEPHSIFKYT